MHGLPCPEMQAVRFPSSTVAASCRGVMAAFVDDKTGLMQPEVPLPLNHSLLPVLNASIYGVSDMGDGRGEGVCVGG